MPARKNRPGKFDGAHHPNSPIAPIVTALVRKFIGWERENPEHDHYVGWPDMDEARRLEKDGYLREGTALGCFFLTDKFRDTFKA